jgi:NAD(P)H-dependent FMN reductase
MKKILAFAGSNSSKSINKELIKFVVSQIDSKVDVIDLNDYDVPIYGIDHENENGIPEGTKQLSKKINDYDYLIVSVNEHNGGISAFFKNHIDWQSRNDNNFLQNKKLFLLSTSPGRGGAKMSLTYAVDILPRFGVEVVSQFSLASFNHSYSEEKGIYDPEQKKSFEEALKSFLAHI